MKEQLTPKQEDLILEQNREHSNEIDDGDFETWLDENKDKAIEGFTEDNQNDFNDFCKERFEETYEDWLKSTHGDMLGEFVEDKESEFNEYVKDKFKEGVE